MEEQNIPFIGKLEEENFEMQLPECCRLFAESEITDKNYQKLLDNCPHVSKPSRPVKSNIGL